MTQETILTISSIVMANLDDNGKPKAHGKTEMEYVTDRLKNK